MDRVLQAKRSVPRTFPLMKGWTSTHLQAREDREIDVGIFGNGLIFRRYVRNLEQEQEQEPQQQIPHVVDSGVGSSQNIVPKDIMQNVMKYILLINYGKTNLLKTLEEVPTHVKTNHLFGLVCDIARSAIGSPTTFVHSVEDKCVKLAESFLQEKDEAFGNCKRICESIVTVEKKKEVLEDLTEFPTFKWRDCYNKVSTSFCLHTFCLS